MVGAGDVVAHRFGRVAAEEDRAGMFDQLQKLVRIFRRDFQMLRRNAIHERRGIVQLRDDDHATIVLPTGARNLLARQQRQRALDRGFDLGGEIGIVGDEDALRRGVVLRLTEQIGGDPVRIVLVVRDDEDFRWTGHGVDPDCAEHFALGGGDISVAGTDDLVHRGNRLCAVGERGYGLRAADAIDFRHPCALRSGQHQRIDLAAACGCHHRDAGDTGHARGHRVHQNGTRIARGTARNVEPDAVERRPAPAQGRAGIVGETVVLGQLAAVIDLDAFRRDIQRGKRILAA